MIAHLFGLVASVVLHSSAKRQAHNDGAMVVVVSGLSRHPRAG